MVWLIGNIAIAIEEVVNQLVVELIDAIMLDLGAERGKING